MLLAIHKGMLLPGILLLSACGVWQTSSQEETSRIETHINSTGAPAFVGEDKRSLELWDWTRQVYTLRQFQPAWSSGGAVLPSAGVALTTLENAADEGLRPEDFDVEELRAALAAGQQTGEAAWTDFDIHLTNALVRYVSQLCDGRMDPQEIDAKWPPRTSTCDVPMIVHDTISNGSTEDLGQRLSPPLLEFKGLRAALHRYRRIASQGGWKPLPVPVSNTPSADLSLVAERLAQSGDLTVAAGEAPGEDAVKAAIERFRLRHGLQAGSAIDEELIAAMNVPVERRIAQIAINMDRMRWEAASFAPNHIRVNIPAFQLSVHENDQAPLVMRVIVGSKEDPTPLLRGEIEYVVFSPYWNVPLSIAKEELLPKIKANPAFLEEQQLEVVRNVGDKLETVEPRRIDWDQVSDGQYQLRQKPGVQNALGLVKFIFPNPYNVYLHDTPSDNLFDRLTRTLSHGCIRLERPVDLAAYLLRDQPEWTAEQIESAMHAGKQKRVPLSTPMPVHLIYWTAWADGEGQVHFRDDVYGHDVLE